MTIETFDGPEKLYPTILCDGCSHPIEGEDIAHALVLTVTNHGVSTEFAHRHCVDEVGDGGVDHCWPLRSWLAHLSNDSGYDTRVAETMAWNLGVGVIAPRDP